MNGYSKALMGFDFADVKTLFLARKKFSAYLQSQGVPIEVAEPETWHLHHSWEFAAYEPPANVHHYHLPGQHDQCDHSVTGECTAEEPAGPRADLFKAEREFVKKPVEHGIAFGSKGQELFREKGGENSIVIGRQLIDKLKKDGNAVYSHNHPRGTGSFSSQDLTMASVTNLKEMRAVTDTPFGKFTFIVTRPKEGWPKMDRINSTYARYKDKILLAIGNRYDPSVKENMMQLNVAASHAMIKVVTDKLKIPYQIIHMRPRK